MPLVCIPDPARVFSLSPVFSLAGENHRENHLERAGGRRDEGEKGREAENMQPVPMVIENADMRYCAELTTSAYSTPRYQTLLNRL